MASPPCTPETYQFTAVFVVPVTEAVKACDSPAGTVAAVGEIETDSGPDAPLGVGLLGLVGLVGLVGFVLPPASPAALVLPVPLLLAAVRDVSGDPERPRLAVPLHELIAKAQSNKVNAKVFIRVPCPRRHNDVWVPTTTGFAVVLKAGRVCREHARLAY